MPKSLNSRSTQVHANFFWRTLSATNDPKTTLYVLSLPWCTIEARKLNHIFVILVFWITIYFSCPDICKKSDLLRYFCFWLIYPTVYKQDQPRHQPHWKTSNFCKICLSYPQYQLQNHILCYRHSYEIIFDQDLIENLIHEENFHFSSRITWETIKVINSVPSLLHLDIIRWSYCISCKIKKSKSWMVKF